ncbi:MAG: DEAD/DEAH box helicase family protein [Candidatus Eremiobacteraeota bacterium]|nr:DEAD/DEAH box helicase family protein [Candidatus Eremiobacteraeota bacterium]
MDNRFFTNPILNSPYQYPAEHWELDEQGQPTQRTVAGRRSPRFISPIPKPKKQSPKQSAIIFDEGKGLSTEDQQYALASVIGELRTQLDLWRARPNPSTWQVSPETARLLEYWRHHEFDGPRPFFCQIEAVETVIWLTEVAPQVREGKRFLDLLAHANAEANPNLMRLALKLATGAGKTTVMAMIIAWQTINDARHPQSKRFTHGFLVVAPGITIRDRLRVLIPNDPGNLYATRQLVPSDLLTDVRRAKVIVTNYHAFMLRERIDLSKGGRALLQGHGSPLQTLETEGQMLQRVTPELMGLKNILVLNDEAHHCYREKPNTQTDDDGLKGDEKKEAEKNTEAARVWITGLETVQRKLGVARVIDLSATPFFLSGSGYTEGTLFPWTMSDFSLMDAIECGIVKLPRVPVSDNIPGGQMPMFRNLWEHIAKKLPKGGKGKKEALDPVDLPPQLQTALDALYGHYVKTFNSWRDAGISVPPCFIVVCNNTATSKLVYDYISGFLRDNADGSQTPVPGRLELFRNFDEHGNALGRPNTILIDSRQLESGEGLDPNFRKMAADEIDRFRREALERGGRLADELRAGKDIDETTLLREVMNTVGKAGLLGGSIRCVVSVSMLTEGWDASTVTHVLGVRAFGTQLLCEQVIGRALRRQSYDLNDRGLFDVEYADVLGVPFDFTAEPVVVRPQQPRETILVKAIRPDRDAAEIRFPRVEGYRVELPRDHVAATFNEDSVLRLTPALIGATATQNSGIIGESTDLTLAHTGDVRPSQMVFELTAHLISKWRSDEAPQSHLFNQLKRITREWLDGYLKCEGGTYPAQLRYKTLADAACNRIIAGINWKLVGERPIKAVLDPFTPSGTTASVNFTTSKTPRWQTDPRRCHLNWAILDSGWEAEFCRVAELHPRVRAYVKNHSLGFEVPYRFGSEVRRYRPDFIVRIEDGHDEDDLLNLVVEIKGYRGEDAKDKKLTMDTYWVPGVNNLGTHGRWAFAEFKDVYEMESDFAAEVSQRFGEMINAALGAGTAEAA